MATATKKAPVSAIARLKTEYQTKYAAELVTELGLKNPMQVPKLEKIVLNIGLGNAKDDKKMIEVATNTLTKITGQKPVETFAKTSIAGFKLREGNKIGLKVTLRGDYMYEFMDRLFNIAMPRIRDFQGFSDRSFDGRGNFSIGLTEQTVFPEVHFDKVKKSQGMEITFVTTANKNQEAKKLL